MSEEQKKRVEQLRRAFEGGLLDEDTFRAAVAALEGADVAAQTISGNVATGDHVRQIEASTYIEQQVTMLAAEGDPVALRRAYLQRVRAQTGFLRLAGVDKATQGDARLQMDAVYTALLTTELRRKEEGNRIQVGAHTRGGPDDGERRLSAVEQLNREPRLVLLGDPGSGKSTFVDFVALCLAGDALGDGLVNLGLLTAPLPADEETRADEKQAEAVPQPWDHGVLLPVRVILRDFAARGLPAAHERATADHLWRFLQEELAAAALEDFAEYLQEELLAGRCLVLLDGLDEVSEAENRRGQMLDAIVDFSRSFGDCRFLVTSRTYAYQVQEWRLPGYADAVLAPFSEGQIRTFVERWYAHSAELQQVDATDAQGRAQLLKHAIFASGRLRELASRPLLLTLMASLHAWRGGSLPDRREELYADAVELLLDRWESQRVVRDAQGNIQIIQPSLQEYLRVDRARLQELLNRLAYRAHAEQPALVGTADIGEADFLAGLVAINRNPDARPMRLVEYLSQRAGLLLPRGVGVYSFPHRTFQEYLAAWHLTNDEYPEKVARLVRADPNRWREVALLAGAKAARGTQYALWSLVEALCGEPPTADWPLEDEWGAHIGGQLIVETAAADGATFDKLSQANQKKVATVREGLVHVVTQSRLAALERAEAGRTLARLGDRRAEVLDVNTMRFCCVAAGPFEMGDDKERHTNKHLDYGYWMARYPVTNAQFEQFVAADGYGNAAYWPEAIAEGFWRDGRFKGRWDHEFRVGPDDWGEPYSLSNHPVVGVSWYEALAFCRWLTDSWRQADLLPADWWVTLPSEAEWEKAARGGDRVPVTPHVLAAEEKGWVVASEPVMEANPQPGRAFPWGDEADGDYANNSRSDIESTSAVGCFLRGVSPYGVAEMSGNVWEWTRTVDGYDYPYEPSDGRERLDADANTWRVLRGGSWANDAVGCGARLRLFPNIVFRVGGFRIVVSPSTSVL